MKFLYNLTWVLLVVGGLNWLFEAVGFNLITELFSSMPSFVDTVYWLVGLSALYHIYLRFTGK
ncbi:uncharacterized membrane protein YuzA (DUF378 family) [Peribacillus deserti]|uniref:Uncharacterized membrane protein YuzA (DUF378 family) n=1 Tax=Peribacillus deserti TaxID=673318 RepID=A0ABS2QJV8_9BACI|nr:DUF378 domain-containing protein [Peribacillus deserti]MBM7693442.1 uncharacterized membrane protein YuzA (DUF378 family) [Peribacillus deserti]